MLQGRIEINTDGRGLYRIHIGEYLKQIDLSLPQTGLLNAFVQHTSASLIIQENADPTAKRDLESFFDRLVPDGETWHEHTLEGPDDTTAHMKSVLTQTSITIPIANNTLALGQWQCLYLWEHRKIPHRRYVLLTIYP